MSEAKPSQLLLEGHCPATDLSIVTRAIYVAVAYVLRKEVVGRSLRSFLEAWLTEEGFGCQCEEEEWSCRAALEGWGEDVCSVGTNKSFRISGGLA